MRETATAQRNGDCAFFDAAAIEDAGLVEMDMRLDHAGDHQTALCFQFRRIGLEGRCDGRNSCALNTDIDGTKLSLLQNAGVTNNQVDQFTTTGSAPR